MKKKMSERNNILCVWRNYEQNGKENCKFIVRRGE